MAKKGISIVARVWLILLVGCVRNTVDPTTNGRVFLLLDMPSSRVARNVVEINMEIENRDPIRLVVFDKSANDQGLTIDVSESADWRSMQSRPVDLVGEVVEGGSEVRFTVRSDQFDVNQTKFRLDGNTTIRLFVANPEKPGVQHIEIELTVQQGLF